MNLTYTGTKAFEEATQLVRDAEAALLKAAKLFNVAGLPEQGTLVTRAAHNVSELR